MLSIAGSLSQQCGVLSHYLRTIGPVNAESGATESNLKQLLEIYKSPMAVVFSHLYIRSNWLRKIEQESS